MTELAFTRSQADALADDLCDNIRQRHGDSYPELPTVLTGATRAQLAVTLAGSQYAYEQFLVHPQWLLAQIQRHTALPSLSYYQSVLREGVAAIDGQLPNTQQIQLLDRLLRRHRNQAMLAIVWAELNQLAPVEIITEHLSALAEASIQVAMDSHYGWLTALMGEPVGEDTGQVQPMLVLGMGKLGAWELNLSSDIDLIFAYPERGNTRPVADSKSRKSVSNQEFFQRLGQRVIKSLDAQTADGFVFRTDMRLRPYGQSGPLAANFGFLEEYYQNQGREWERYAMIKARVVACSEMTCSEVVSLDRRYCQSAANELMQLLRPFSYRRYVDFSVINALRDMKALINREVKLRNKTQDVKLGRGGIREVEFIAQAFQLVRGGREPVLQERRLLKVLPTLVHLGVMPDATADALAQGYRFLRRVEHALQAWQDRQTQALPTDAQQQARLAFVLGFESWPACFDHLESVRAVVDSEFQAVVGDSQQHQAETREMPMALWVGITQSQLSTEEALEICVDLGLQSAETVLTQLNHFASNRLFNGLPASSRTKLDQLMALLLQQLTDLDWQSLAWPDLPAQLDHAQLLARTLPLLENIARRSAYLVLLLENPTVLPHLLRLFTASAWIAEQITAHPALLEELLDTHNLHTVPEPELLRAELEQALAAIPADDLEQQMDTLRYFRRAHGLRVAACEVSGTLPLMKVSDYLTWVAEEIVRQVLAIAWADMVGKYGWPGDSQGIRHDKGFIIVAYGKAGGLEMAHGSDLDLVFIHDCEATGSTDGDKSDGSKSIDTQTFYTRLGQKIIHILNTRTNAGRLYEVDMRLRPSGNSGLLVTSIAAFEKYQCEQAWTWEHQALLRARPVAGSESLVDRFSQLRRSVLCRQRDRTDLRQQVVDMRNKMLDHLGSKAHQAQFNLKQDRGGIVDIEFMVQYAALAWAVEYPELVVYSDNIRILAALQQAGLITEQEEGVLAEAYKAYRAAGHRLALQQQDAVLPADALTQHRQQVEGMWRRLMEG